MNDTGSDAEGDDEAGQSKQPSRFKQIAAKLNEEDRAGSESDSRDRADSFSNDGPSVDLHEGMSDRRSQSRGNERKVAVNRETEPTVGTEPGGNSELGHDAVPGRKAPDAGDRDRSASDKDATGANDTIESWEWVSADDETDADAGSADDRSDPSTESTSVVSDSGTEDSQKQNKPGSGPADAPVNSDEGTDDDPTGHGKTSPPAGGSAAAETEEGDASDQQENQSDVASKARLWNREDSDSDRQKSASTPSRSSGSATVEDATPDAPTGDARDSREGGQLADRQFTPGTNVLVQSGSQDDRTHGVCQDLLYSGSSDPYALLVRYRKMDPERLGQIASHTHHTKVIAVGYSQPTPASEDANVECVQINSPNDITRLGIIVSGTLDDWADDGRDITFCYDSLNVLLNYRDVKSTFRFLHVFLSTLDQAEAIGHFHVDSVGGNPQDISTLKPLFDEIVSIDSVGVHLE